MARRQRKPLRQRCQPLPRPASEAPQTEDRRAERRARRAGLHRQRQRRGHRPLLPHLLPSGRRQRRFDRPDLRHVPRRRRHQRRRDARGPARRGLLASDRRPAGGRRRAHPSAVALLPEQPHGQRLPGGRHRTAAPRIRRHGRPRRSLHRLRRRAGIPRAPRRIREPHRPANPLEGVGHGRASPRAGIRIGSRRRTFRTREISLQHQQPRAAGRRRTAHRRHRPAGGRNPRRARPARSSRPAPPSGGSTLRMPISSWSAPPIPTACTTR